MMIGSKKSIAGGLKRHSREEHLQIAEHKTGRLLDNMLYHPYTLDA
jgi:hypothetical protein